MARDGGLRTSLRERDRLQAGVQELLELLGRAATARATGADGSRSEGGEAGAERGAGSETEILGVLASRVEALEEVFS